MSQPARFARRRGRMRAEGVSSPTALHLDKRAGQLFGERTVRAGRKQNQR
jgi:hypothetical protein